MQIYVVQKGDTLTNISKLFGVPVDLIVSQNKIAEPNNLLEGQTIIIPVEGMYHFVQQGEDLTAISNLYGIPLFEIISVNKLSNFGPLPVGFPLYIPRKSKTVIETSAYDDISLTKDNSPKIISEIGNALTTLPVFSYQVNRDGSLTLLDDNPTLNAAFNNGVAPVLVITNIEDGQFSQELATLILNDEALQEKVLEEAIKIIEEKGYFGLDVDFEYLGAENKEAYVKFLAKAKEMLNNKNPNYKLSVALPPKTSEDQKGTLYEGHDYEAIGKIVDQVLMMTYEWGWSGGPPMAVSPLNKVKEVMEYALTKIPRNKILMGVPLYGYDWTLPYQKSGKWAKAIDQVEAYDIANRYGAVIEYDDLAQTPFFTYVDEEGNEHEVWFEDARSYQAKFDYVKELGISGLYNWVLGFDSPQNWLLIEDNFIPVKLFR
ncbi:glycoside hydrolase family 18 protein [Mycoplasmatota bacterium zrk1]